MDGSSFQTASLRQLKIGWCPLQSFLFECPLPNCQVLPALPADLGWLHEVRSRGPPLAPQTWPICKTLLAFARVLLANGLKMAAVANLLCVRGRCDFRDRQPMVWQKLWEIQGLCCGCLFGHNDVDLTKWCFGAMRPLILSQQNNEDSLPSLGKAKTCSIQNIFFISVIFEGIKQRLHSWPHGLVPQGQDIFKDCNARLQTTDCPCEGRGGRALCVCGFTTNWLALQQMIVPKSFVLTHLRTPKKMLLFSGWLMVFLKQMPLYRCDRGSGNTLNHWILGWSAGLAKIWWECMSSISSL